MMGDTDREMFERVSRKVALWLGLLAGSDRLYSLLMWKDGVKVIRTSTKMSEQAHLIDDPYTCNGPLKFLLRTKIGDGSVSCGRVSDTIHKVGYWSASTGARSCRGESEFLSLITAADAVL